MSGSGRFLKAFGINRLVFRFLRGVKVCRWRLGQGLTCAAVIPRRIEPLRAGEQGQEDQQGQGGEADDEADKDGLVGFRKTVGEAEAEADDGLKPDAEDGENGERGGAHGDSGLCGGCNHGLRVSRGRCAMNVHPTAR